MFFQATIKTKIPQIHQDATGVQTALQITAWLEQRGRDWTGLLPGLVLLRQVLLRQVLPPVLVALGLL